MMSTAEWTGENPAELDLDVPENSTEEDDKLREYWAKKERRRSSFLKDFVGDSLRLKDNQRILMHLTKFGETAASSSCFYAVRNPSSLLRSHFWSRRHRCGEPDTSARPARP